MTSVLGAGRLRHARVPPGNVDCAAGLAHYVADGIRPRTRQGHSHMSVTCFMLLESRSRRSSWPSDATSGDRNQHRQALPRPTRRQPPEGAVHGGAPCQQPLVWEFAVRGLDRILVNNIVWSSASQFFLGIQAFRVGSSSVFLSRSWARHHQGHFRLSVHSSWRRSPSFRANCMRGCHLSVTRWSSRFCSFTR